MPRKNAIFLLFLVLFLIFPKNIFAWSASDPPVSYSLFSTINTRVFQISVGSNGYVYAPSTSDNKTSIFDSNGNFIVKFGTAFSGPTSAAITSDGRVLVANFQQDKIEIYDTSGNPISTFGSTGSANNQFYGPFGILVDPNTGNIFVADAYNNRVQKFDTNLNYLSTITGNGTSFDTPEMVAIDPSGNIFIVDSGNSRVQEFDTNGTYIRTITGHGGAWSWPESIAVDTSGNLYVADTGNDKIQVFDSSGNFQQEFGSSGTGLGQFQYIGGLFMTSAGVLYIADDNRIQKAVFDRSVATVSVSGFADNVITGTATDSLSVLTNIEYTIDGGSYQPCTATDGAIDEASETFSCNVGVITALGSHTISVRATDAKSNTNSGSSLASYTLTVNPNAVDPPRNTCTNLPPATAPAISNIVRGLDKAVITFSTVSGADNYVIEYGIREESQFSVQFSEDKSNISKSYVVNYLNNFKDYYFRIRGGNDCAVGPWSSWRLSHGENVIQSIPPVLPLSTPNPTEIPLKTLSPTAIPAIPTLVPTLIPRQTFGPEVEIQNENKVDMVKVIKNTAVITTIATGSYLTTNFILFFTGMFGSFAYVYRNSKRSFLNFPIDFIGALASFPTVFKSRKTGGVVFDTVSNLPVSNALILFFSDSGNLKSTFSNKNGKYEIKLKPDDYKIRVDKEKYTFPSESIKVSTNGVYTNIYVHPAKIPVTDVKPVVNEVSLALDPKNKFWPTFISITMRLALYVSLSYIGTQLAKFALI